jgi:hypothetical protein
MYIVKRKVIKLQAWTGPEGFQEDWGFQIARRSAHEGSKIVSLTYRPPLPGRKYSLCWFLLETEWTPGATVRPVGLCQWKIPITPSGIEPRDLIPKYYNVLPKLSVPDKLVIFWKVFVWPLYVKKTSFNWIFHASAKFRFIAMKEASIQ